MAKYFLFVLRAESDCEFETIFQKVFTSIGSSFLQFYALVGQYSSDFSTCCVESYDTQDSPYLKKTRVSCGDVRIYIYLQKLS